MTTPNTPATTGSLPSADTVKIALSKRGCSPEQLGDLLWLLNHAKQSNLRTNAEVGGLISRDASVISKLFRGVYEADVEPICDQIRHYRRVWTERRDFGEIPYVDGLTVVRDITTLCDLARISQTMALVWGKNQSGKTGALKHYAKLNNHGRTLYVRMPVSGAAKLTLKEICMAAGISDRDAYEVMLERVKKYLDSDILLIVDEVHQALLSRTIRINTMEMIRELHDTTGCGVVLCGTDVLPEMIQDARFSKLLGQMDNRGVLKRKIPSRPTRRDLRLLWTAYGFPCDPSGDAETLVNDIAEINGIGKLTKYFLMARRLASRSATPLDWTHFVSTHATLKAWAEGKRTKQEEEAE